MDALWYSEATKFEVKRVPIPGCGKNDILIKVSMCGLCGTDQHIHNGGFRPNFPLIPGHEVVGAVAALGDSVSPSEFAIGDRVVADVSLVCGDCFYCRRGRSLMCESFGAKGIQAHGAFAEYVCFHKDKCFKIGNMTDSEATLLEPTSCAVHGLDKLKPPAGCSVLMLGAGPTGLILAQLLKSNGASNIVLAANSGPKMDLAETLGAADHYVRLDRVNPGPQWEGLNVDYPHGFDVVVEATGAEGLADKSLQFVRRGGTLLVYGVYSEKSAICWSPSFIFRNEIRVIGSFSQTLCFPRAIEFLESRRVKVQGMVTHLYGLGEFEQALAKLASRDCCKIAVQLAK